ncbi:MAG: hypothetical protein ACLFS6_06540 [Methanomassiliicoccales archaeon]
MIEEWTSELVRTHHLKIWADHLERVGDPNVSRFRQIIPEGEWTSIDRLSRENDLDGELIDLLQKAGLHILELYEDMNLEIEHDE